MFVTKVLFLQEQGWIFGHRIKLIHPHVPETRQSFVKQEILYCAKVLSSLPFPEKGIISGINVAAC